MKNVYFLEIFFRPCAATHLYISQCCTNPFLKTFTRIFTKFIIYCVCGQSPIQQNRQQPKHPQPHLYTENTHVYAHIKLLINFLPISLTYITILCFHRNMEYKSFIYIYYKQVYNLRKHTHMILCYVLYRRFVR